MLKFLVVPATLAAIAFPVVAAPQDSGRATANTSAGSAGDGRRGLMRYDANQDGAVDRSEWKAGQEARFRQLDRDRDGTVTRDELFARSPATGNSVLPSDRQAQRQTRYLELLDADRDGSVSLVEFLSQGERNFGRCDLDDDGRIDSGECRQALRPTRAQPAR